jgi:hypothetical protein
MNITNDESSTDSFIELIQMQTSTIIIKPKTENNFYINILMSIYNYIISLFYYNTQIKNIIPYKNFNYYKNIIKLNIDLFNNRNNNTSIYIFNKAKITS